MIKCLLTELDRAGQEDIGHDLKANIFPSDPPTQSIHCKYILFDHVLFDTELLPLQYIYRTRDKIWDFYEVRYHDNP